MKRTHAGWFARLSPEGRVLEVGPSLRVLDGGCDQVVRCRVVLEAERKPSRLGRRAQARRAAGGPRVMGRPAMSLEEWITKQRPALFMRDTYRCRSCGLLPDGICATLDPHHVTKAGQGGSDFDLDFLVSLCRRVDGIQGCHEWTDEPFAGPRGRLIVEALGGGRFNIFPVRKADKFAPDPVMP